MKEIGKLLELLNEYVEKHNKSDLYYTFELEDNGWLFCYDDVTDHKGWTMQDEAMVICSKKFGFIKWLVDNDKIDRYKFEVEYMDKQTLEDVYIAGAKQNELLIMILSISDTPIEDLVSYLK